MPPAVAGDIVFIGSCSGTFSALDAKSGDPLWTYDVGADGKQMSFHGAILLEKDRVVFGTDHSCAPGGIGHVYAAEPSSGRILWKYRSAVGVSSNLVRARSFVCFGTNMGDWGCLNANTGKLEWTATPVPARECEMPAWSATDGERLYVRAADGSLAALRTSDGTVIWRRQLGGPATTSLTLDRGVLYVGANDKRLYALHAATGRIKESALMSGTPEGRPKRTQHGLFILLKDERLDRGELVALDPATLRVKWRRGHDRSFASEEAHVWRDVVVVADCRGAVHAFAAADGAPRWDMHLTGCIRSISSSGELLFIGAQEGTVYAVRP